MCVCVCERETYVPGHGQDGAFLVVVAVTLGDVLPQDGQHPHHADSLLSGAVNAVLVPVQHAQGVIRCLQSVKTRLDEILMDLNLQGNTEGEMFIDPFFLCMLQMFLNKAAPGILFRSPQR